jgi:hypothetical protein
MTDLDDLAHDLAAVATKAELMKSLDGLSSLWQLTRRQKLPDYPIFEALDTINKLEVIKFEDLLLKLQANSKAQVSPTGVIHMLLADGLISKTAVPSDQRQFTITLTPDGQRRLEMMAERLYDLFSEPLDTFTAKDQRVLVSLLRRLNEALISVL